MSEELDEPISIRSYRVCFQLERRLHKIDRWRIPVPYGVPLRGIVYGAGLLAAVVVLSLLPLTGVLLSALPVSLRYVVLPLLGAYLLLRWKVDGRPAHATALSAVRMRLGPRRLAGWRPAPALGTVRLGAVTIAPDERGGRLRRGTVEGTGQLVLRYPVTLAQRGRTLRVSADGDQPLWRGKQINLRAGQRVMIG